MEYVLEAFTLSVVAQEPCPLGDTRIPCDNGSAVPERAEILRRIETERRGVADRPCTLAFDLRTMRLSAVFDECQSVESCDPGECRKVRALAVEVHRQDRRGARSDRCLHLRD